MRGWVGDIFFMTWLKDDMELKRSTDNEQTKDIERMIAAEADPRVRVQLMIMHKLTDSVAAIGGSVADLDEKFTTHTVREEAVVNQALATWRILRWLFGIAQVLIVYVYLDLHNDLTALTAAQQDLNARVAVLEAKEKIK